MRLDVEDTSFLFDPGRALSSRQHWENAFHAELTAQLLPYEGDLTALTASLLPSWVSTRAERALLRLSAYLPGWAGEFIRRHQFADPENVASQAGAMPPVKARDVADALARTLATAAFAQHTLALLSERRVSHKRWVTRHDNLVRDSHRAADAQVVPLSAPFVVGGALMQYPGDARTAPIAQWINDRCVLIGSMGP